MMGKLIQASKVVPSSYFLNAPLSNGTKRLRRKEYDVLGLHLAAVKIFVANAGICLAAVGFYEAAVGLLRFVEDEDEIEDVKNKFTWLKTMGTW